MAAKKMKKITKRWLINSFGVMLIIVVAMVVAISISVRSYYYNGARQFLLSRSDAVATLLENYSRDSSVDFSVQLRRLVEDYEYKSQSELMAIDGDKNVIITSSGFEPGDALEMPDYDRAYSSQTGVGEFVGYAESGEKVMAVTVMSRIISDDLSAMRYVVSLTRIDRQIWTLVLFACLLGLAIVLFVLYTSFYFINSIIIPIGEVGQTAKQIAQGDLGVRILVEKDDEIGELCASINNMAEELSNAEKVKNDFISSVSHELRTPLTAIRGWGETLLDSGEPDRDTFRKGMRVIMEETERLSSMVEELLDFSRMQSGRLVMEKERLDAVAELSDAVLIFTERARQENKALEYQEPEFFAPVLGDHNRLRQVFVNILDNALKYSDSGDTVTVLPRLAGECFIVVVSDTGCGISQEDLPMVKDRFYKGHTTRRGSGIGLAVADEIIKKHGGTLELDSVKDQGTSVKITLPLDTKKGSTSD